MHKLGKTLMFIIIIAIWQNQVNSAFFPKTSGKWSLIYGTTILYPWHDSHEYHGSTPGFQA